MRWVPLFLYREGRTDRFGLGPENRPRRSTESDERPCPGVGPYGCWLLGLLSGPPLIRSGLSRPAPPAAGGPRLMTTVPFSTTVPHLWLALSAAEGIAWDEWAQSL